MVLVMEVDKVADEVTDMEVDKVTNVVAEITNEVKIVKGIVHHFFSLLKSHILGYDGVWYSSF